ncbi:MAG TPA: hypothetical protein VEY71_06910, partial [Chitinophagales bacterium]|nr:hypothetical protein [Chitinophagales bacterium]
VVAAGRSEERRRNGNCKISFEHTQWVFRVLLKLTGKPNECFQTARGNFPGSQRDLVWQFVFLTT